MGFTGVSNPRVKIEIERKERKKRASDQLHAAESEEMTHTRGLWYVTLSVVLSSESLFD